MRIPRVSSLIEGEGKVLTKPSSSVILKSQTRFISLVNPAVVDPGIVTLNVPAVASTNSTPCPDVNEMVGTASTTDTLAVNLATTVFSGGSSSTGPTVIMK